MSDPNAPGNSGQPPEYGGQPGYGSQPDPSQPAYPAYGSQPGQPAYGGGQGGYGGPGGYGPGGPMQPPPGGQQPPAPKGFFGALFDFSFNTFVTPMIVKVVYVLIVVAIALGLVVLIIGGFIDSVGAGIALLLLAWIPALIYLAFFRMTLEFYYSVVRMSEDIHHRGPQT